MSRYDSQSKVLDQKKISKLNVAVIGTGPLTHYILTAFCGLGVGNIHFLNDNQRISEGDFLFFGETPNNRLESLEKIIRKMNSDIKVSTHDEISTGGQLSESMLDLIIDLTNDSNSKGLSLQYASAKKIPFISAASDEFTSILEVYNPKIMEIKSQKDIDKFKMLKYQNRKQGTITSGIMAGLAAEELRKLFLPVNSDKEIIGTIYYNLLSSERFNDKKDIDISLSYEGKKILMVGAGSLGTFAGIALILSAGNRNNSLTIADPDIVEEHNLNRQVFYFDDLDQPKVDSLAKKFKKINSHLDITGRYAKVALEPDKSEKERGVSFISEEEIKQYDLIVGCLDSPYTRKILNEWAVRNKIPYIDGASAMQFREENKDHYENGQVNVYIPEKTICQSCQKNLEKVKRKGTDVCAREPALIMPNMIAGIMEAAEASMFLSGFKDYKGSFHYLSNKKDRLRFVPFGEEKLSTKCYLNCH